MNLWGAIQKIMSGGVSNQYRALRCSEEGYQQFIQVDENGVPITASGAGAMVYQQETTLANLELLDNTGPALACDGATQLHIEITLTTATTNPVLQIQGSSDGTNWYSLSNPLTSVINLTVSLRANNVLPAMIRWKVITAGVAVGAGYKIVLRAR